ncbi:MAG: tripartite tricarboxylate transporter substrate binding protein [Burkholderiales bacterium]|jgi:tripartite-type tricarboxylate transporter receptor subunit TctC|nr:tripartite tricarboxylate transporter substrate binding protein [Burkholderiales bacterium]
MALACASAIGADAPAAFPAKPVRLVVPFPPGGSTDIIARVIGQKLSDSLGQQVIVENKPGAGGNIGVEMVARAPADGYTLVMGHVGTFGSNPALYKRLPYDPVKDFAPVTLVAMVPNLLVVQPALPVRSTQELIALARAKPGQLTYGSGGNGSAAHLAAEYFKALAGVDIQHVPYKGTAPALTDLLGGQISMQITGAPPLLPYVKSGKVRVLATASAQRLKILPDVPTIAESGVPGYAATQWYGILAPAATPKPIVEKLNREIVKAINSPDVRARLEAEGAEPVGNTPAAFAAFIRSELALWAKVVKDSGATID